MQQEPLQQQHLQPQQLRHSSRGAHTPSAAASYPLSPIIQTTCCTTIKASSPCKTLAITGSTSIPALFFLPLRIF